MVYIPRFDMKAARKLAIANAEYFKEAYAVFFDTAGNVRVEREGDAPHDIDLELWFPNGGKWEGILYNKVDERKGE